MIINTLIAFFGLAAGSKTTKFELWNRPCTNGYTMKVAFWSTNGKKK